MLLAISVGGLALKEVPENWVSSYGHVYQPVPWATRNLDMSDLGQFILGFMISNPLWLVLFIPRLLRHHNCPRSELFNRM